jgi:mitogen-activated protein kinase kinase
LETKTIIHRDIKPANMLINKNAMVKLCDFGICGDLSEIRSDVSLVEGTAAYLSPTPEYCAIQDDMWALGMSLLEIVSGKHPFASWTLHEIPIRILQWQPIVPMTISDDMQKLILHL